VTRSSRSRILLVVACASLALAACGSDEPAADSDTPSVGTTSSAPPSNACPVDGCVISIVDVAKEGDEIAVTWDANFNPDVSKNHIHIFWDRYTPEQVSSDAEANNLKQGEWVPTDAVPTYVTGSAVSVKNRGDSTTICATAGDRDHVVIDPSLVDCRDVSALLN
jgi:hypothetical protein